MKWIKRLRKMTALILCVLMLAGTESMLVYAAEPGSILSKKVSEGKIFLYLKDSGTEEVQVQIGTVKCTDVQVSKGTDSQISTLILVDNSQSIAEKYRPVINELLTSIVASKGANECFSIATFSDRIDFLVEDSTDYSTLKKTIDAIEYDSHDAWLVPVLHDIFTAWGQDDETVFRKIIVISDGASEEKTGYTLSELNNLIQNNPYPIYSFGADGEGNKDELDQLFALSRLTKGESWLLSDVSDSLEIASAVSEGSNIQKVIISPPTELCDGTEKGVRVEAGGTVDQTTVLMPFRIEEATGTQLTEVETEVKTEAQMEAQPTELEQDGHTADQAMHLNWVVLVAVVLLLTVVAIVVIWRVKQKKIETPNKEDSDVETVDISDKDDDTVWANQGENLTVDVFNRKKTPKLILTNVYDPNQRSTAPLKGSVLVGRPDKQGKQDEGNRKINIQDPSVSRKHCTFRYDNDRLYVSDAGSKNGTIVNGNVIHGETEVYDGNRIILGDIELKVEIQK